MSNYESVSGLFPGLTDRDYERISKCVYAATREDIAVRAVKAFVERQKAKESLKYCEE